MAQVIYCLGKNTPNRLKAVLCALVWLCLAAFLWSLFVALKVFRKLVYSPNTKEMLFKCAWFLCSKGTKLCSRTNPCEKCWTQVKVWISGSSKLVGLSFGSLLWWDMWSWVRPSFRLSAKWEHMCVCVCYISWRGWAEITYVKWKAECLAAES